MFESVDEPGGCRRSQVGGVGVDDRCEAEILYVQRMGERRRGGGGVCSEGA